MWLPHAAALVAVFKLASGFPYAQTFSKYFTWIVSFSFITTLMCLFFRLNREEN